MIKELTSLRFIFILAIFIHHLDIYEGGGSMGVAFFFVLSGFSLTLGYGEKILNQDFSYKKYIKKRLFKFYPIHWLCLLISIPIVLIEGHWITPAFLANVALLQTWIPISDFYFSFNSVSWYLADTVFLALVFPCLCRLLAKRSDKWRALFICALILLYALTQVALYSKNVYAFIYINPVSGIPDFIFGMMMAFIYKDLKLSANYKSIQRNVEDKKSIILFACFALIACLVYVSTLLSKHQASMAFYYWPFVILIIWGASLLGICTKSNILRHRILVYLGGASFEFYMLHQLIIRYCVYVQEQLLGCSNLMLTAGVGFVLSLTLSVIVKKYFEDNISKRLLNRLE